MAHANTNFMHDLKPLFVLVDELVRDVPASLGRVRAGGELASVARASLLSIAVAGAVFGAGLGLYRGGVQIAYAAIKLPLLMLMTLALCAPALTAVGRALGRESLLSQDIALMLGALARASVVLAAQTPLILLAVQIDMDYHRLMLCVVACSGLAGGVGLVYLLRGLWQGGRRGLLTLSAVQLALVCMVGAQLAWTLRPFVLRPASRDVPFVRAIEGSFVDSLATTAQSAQGIYRRTTGPGARLDEGWIEQGEVLP